MPVFHCHSNIYIILCSYLYYFKYILIDTLQICVMIVRSKVICSGHKLESAGRVHLILVQRSHQVTTVCVIDDIRLKLEHAFIRLCCIVVEVTDGLVETGIRSASILFNQNGFPINVWSNVS